MKGKPSRKSDNTATQKKQETHIPEAFSLSTDDAPTPPPYRLPDDPYPPSRPRTDVELLLIYEMHHSAVAKPDRSFATNEDRTKDQLSLAQQAMTDLWKWIASHADNGNFEAQCIIFQIAENLTSGFLGGVKNKLPGIMHYAHGRVAMPGMVSQDKGIQAYMAALCREIGLGKDYPFPLEHIGGRKQKANLVTPSHLFVHDLWSHLDTWRKWLQKWSPRNPIEESIKDLPPLSSRTWKQWRDVGRKQVEFHTDGNPLQHACFKPGRHYASLANLDSRGTPVLWKKLSKAWQFLADNMNATSES